MKKKITPETEQKLAAALSDVAHYVEAGGFSPEAALIKSAKESDFTPDQTALLVQAYNNGRTLQHIQTAAGYREKTAEFPVVSAPAVLSAVFPDKIKTATEVHAETAISRDYAGAPLWQESRQLSLRLDGTRKTASAWRRPTRTRRDLTNALLQARTQMKNTVRELRQKAADCKFRAAEAVGALAEYFRKNADIPFSEVADNARILFGKTGSAVMERARKQCAGALRNALPVKTGAMHPVRHDRPPYSLLKTAVSAIHRMQRTEQQASRAAERAEVLEGKIAKALGYRKYSGTMGWLNFGLATKALNKLKTVQEQADRQMPDAADTGPWTSDSINALAEPPHQSILQDIQRKTLLSELIGTDEVLQGYDPEEVTAAYEALTELAPAATLKRALVLPYLRKYLEQSRTLDPYDLEQLTKTDQMLRGSSPAGGEAPRPGAKV